VPTTWSSQAPFLQPRTAQAPRDTYRTEPIRITGTAQITPPSCPPATEAPGARYRPPHPRSSLNANEIRRTRELPEIGRGAASPPRARSAGLGLGREAGTHLRRAAARGGGGGWSRGLHSHSPTHCCAALRCVAQRSVTERGMCVKELGTREKKVRFCGSPLPLSGYLRNRHSPGR
jgi:hypothetical protein